MHDSGNYLEVVGYSWASNIYAWLQPRFVFCFLCQDNLFSAWGNVYDWLAKTTTKKLPNLSALGLEYVLTVLTSHFSIDLMYTQLKQLVKLLNFGVHVAF